MAIPLRSPAPRRTSSRTSNRPSIRPAGRPPQLAVVRGRRQVAWFAVSLTVLVSLVMIGAILLHTRIAERQLEIDRLERDVRTAQEEFDVLRSERAQLRSPDRLAEGARALGMVPGSESEFVPVDPMLVASAIASTGQVPYNDQIIPGSDVRLEPLDQFRLVKSVGSEAP